MPVRVLVAEEPVDEPNGTVVAIDGIKLAKARPPGRSWKELEKPGPLVDLAVDPMNARHIVATCAGGLEEGLFESRDGGES